MSRHQPAPLRNKLLYTGDSNQFFYFEGTYDRRGLPRSIHTFIRLIARNGVDTYLCNPNDSLAFYPSKVVATALDGYRRGDRGFFKAHVEGEHHTAEAQDAAYRFLTGLWDRYLDLAEQGIDWLWEVTRACRANRIAPWLTVRMNDMHGWFDLDRGHMNNPLLKNPRLRLPGRSRYPGRAFLPAWAKALNYGRKEVRDYMFRMIKELVEDYDYEGLELDFLRNTALLEPIASPAGVRLIADWIGSIRELTLRRTRRTGKRFPLGLRIPSHLVLLKERGLDVKLLARERLIDFAGVSNWYQTGWDIPYDQLREELGNLVLYGDIEFMPNDLYAWDPATGAALRRSMPSCPPLLYGNAAAKHALKVDGIELFNFFNGDSPAGIADYKALRHIGSAAALRGRDKQYAFSSNLVLGCWEDTIENLPCLMRRGTRHAFRLPMLAEPRRKNAELAVQVIYEPKRRHEFIGVAINGAHPTYVSEPAGRFLYAAGSTAHLVEQKPGKRGARLKPEYASRVFRFSTDRIREGWNSIILYYGDFDDHSDATDFVAVVGLELAVRRRSPRKRLTPARRARAKRL